MATLPTTDVLVNATSSESAINGGFTVGGTPAGNQASHTPDTILPMVSGDYTALETKLTTRFDDPTYYTA